MKFEGQLTVLSQGQWLRGGSLEVQIWEMRGGRVEDCRLGGVLEVRRRVLWIGLEMLSRFFLEFLWLLKNLWNIILS